MEAQTFVVLVLMLTTMEAVIAFPVPLVSPKGHIREKKVCTVISNYRKGL